MNRQAGAKQIAQIINDAKDIAIIQADNPDLDSLASSLALEQILGDMGKATHLYCGVDLPSYLHYIEGWDRVASELPKKFDASIIVDTASQALLEQLDKSGAMSWVAARPAIVIDHHATEATISFAKVLYSQPAVATAELIYELSGELGWQLNGVARKMIAIAILSDSLGLMSEATSARSIRIISELVDQGVNLPEIDSARRASLRRPPDLIHYKGRLLERVEFHSGDRIATVSIPWEEIEEYSPLYNPSMLVIDDMRLGTNTNVAIAFKIYRDGKVTAKIRCNWGWGIADKLAEHFKGGGHPLASGFKVTDGRSYEDVKGEAIKVASELLDEIEKVNNAKAA